MMPTGIAIDGTAKGKELTASMYIARVPVLEGYDSEGPVFGYTEYIWNGAAWTVQFGEPH